MAATNCCVGMDSLICATLFVVMSDAIGSFIDEFAKSLSSGSFVKLTLSNYKGADKHLQKIAARLIDTKRGPQLSFQTQHTARQTVRNHAPKEAPGVVAKQLSAGFRSAHLFTTQGDFQLTVGKRNARIISGKPTFAEKPSTAHNRQKAALIDPDAYYLKALGVATDNGEIRAQQQDKWRQINKYVEILRDLYDSSSLANKRSLKIVDMGSGKGYLTFAAYDYLSRSRGLNVEMMGVETRPELVKLCNEIARSADFDGLKFAEGTISDFSASAVDILIALHACDTATDDALFKGISSNAEVIVAAPCCHKEVRRQMKQPPDLLKDILKHGSILEREAESITDGLRSMLLERSGYSTKIFEFISSEHTPKNNMIVAVKNHARPGTLDQLQERIEAVKSFYGIEEQRLENLLA